MTTFGLIPFPLRAALQLLLGLGLMAAPFVVGLEALAAIVCVAAGAVTVGLAFASTVNERGTTSLPLSAIHGFDLGLALGLLGGAGVLAIAGYEAAAIVLTGFGVGQLLLSATTRYTLRA